MKIEQFTEKARQAVSDANELANPMCKYSCQRNGSWSLLLSEEVHVSEEGHHEPGRVYYHMFRRD